MADEQVLILTEQMFEEELPRQSLSAPVNEPHQDDESPAEVVAESDVDENLAALAIAESEIAAAEVAHVQSGGNASLTYLVLGPRALAALKRRGRAVWGAIAVGLATSAWIFPFVESFLSRWRRRALLDLDSRRAVEGLLLLAAVVFGTIGGRRVAGKKMAIVGRLMAWCTPTLALILDAIYFGDEGFGIVAALAAFGVWLAFGFFIFAMVDAMVEP